MIIRFFRFPIIRCKRKPKKVSFSVPTQRTTHFFDTKRSCNNWCEDPSGGTAVFVSEGGSPCNSTPLGRVRAKSPFAPFFSGVHECSPLGLAPMSAAKKQITVVPELTSHEDSAAAVQSRAETSKNHNQEGAGNARERSVPMPPVDRRQRTVCARRSVVDTS